MKSNALLIPLIAALAATASAQTTKPKPKPKKQPPERIVKGTVQMAGDDGKANVTYTLGKVQPINVTVTDVRFNPVREIVAGRVVAPSKTEKLLVVDFIAHNPNPEAIRFGGRTIKFVGVDQESVNREGYGVVTRAKTGEAFDAELKPAQKVELRTVIVVPAAGTVPKLMLEHRSGGPVLRYDLKPILKPLADGFKDPKDDTGMSVTDTFQCLPDTFYSMPNFDIKLAPDAIAFHGQKFGPNTVEKESVFCTFKFVLKGQSPQPAFLRFEGDVYDENGEKYPILRLSQVSTEEHVSRYLEQGTEYSIRMLTIIPAKAKPKQLRIRDTSGNSSRLFVFDLPAGN